MEVIFVRLKTPVEGTWKFYIYSLTNIKGSYNAWLPLKQFSGQDIYFLKSDPDTTLTVPAAADGVISVGAYNHYTGAAYYESGRGYMELLHLEALRLLEQAMQRLMPGAVLHFYIHIR